MQFTELSWAELCNVWSCCNQLPSMTLCHTMSILNTWYCQHIIGIFSSPCFVHMNSALQRPVQHNHHKLSDVACIYASFILTFTKYFLRYTKKQTKNVRSRQFKILGSLTPLMFLVKLVSPKRIYPHINSHVCKVWARKYMSRFGFYL